MEKVTDEVDTKTLSTKKPVLIVGQPHSSSAFKYYGRMPPSPISGKVKAKAFPRLHPYRSPKLFSAFSFDATGPKEKANKKKRAEKKFRLCGGDQGSAFGNRKLLKKFDQNF